MTLLQKMHISFYVGSCDNGFHSDEILFISLFIINMSSHQIRWCVSINANETQM